MRFENRQQPQTSSQFLPFWNWFGGLGQGWCDHMLTGSWFRENPSYLDQSIRWEGCGCSDTETSEMKR